MRSSTPGRSSFRVRREKPSGARPRRTRRARPSESRRSNSSPLDAPVGVPPRARDRAVDEEGPDRLRHLRREDPRPVLLGKDSASAAHGRGAARPTSVGSGPVPASRGRGAARAGGRGARRPARRGSGGAAVARAPARRRRAACPPTARCPSATPARRRRGSAGRDARSAVGLRRRPPARPSLGRLEEMRATLLPRSRRRHPHELEPRPDHPPAARRRPRRAPRGGAARPASSACSSAACRSRSRSVGRGFCTRSHHSRCAAPDRDGERPVVAPRDDVDRLAHQRRLDHRAALERPRQVAPPETLEARPEADVGVRRVLVLDAADPLERARDRETHALEQELSREQCAVQLALREGALAPRLDASRSAPTAACHCVAAIPPTTSAPPSTSQSVIGSSSTTAPIAPRAARIAYVYETARVGPSPLRPTFQQM